MQIFISYRRVEDKASNIVYIIHDKLAGAFGKENVFRDTRDIVAGTEWRDKLDTELNSCKVMLVVIGPDWASQTDAAGNKRLFIETDVTRWEVETGLRRRKEEGIALIPVLVQGARLPGKDALPPTLHELAEIQSLPLRNDRDLDVDLDRLIENIRTLRGIREDDIKIQEEFEPKTIYIAKGPFWMGNPPEKGIPSHETPQHQVDLPAYRIGKYPVTNKQYAVFMRKTGRSALELGWKVEKIPEGQENHPVTGVSWYDALAYCRWLGEPTGRAYMLPNEAQWEKACRGGNKTLYPWGDEPDPARSNLGQPELAAVDKYQEQSNYGCFDFVGNVRQWTRSLWGTDIAAPDPEYCYPWQEGRDDLQASRLVWRVLRGSSFGDKPARLRCSYKSGDSPESRGFKGSLYGFRVAMTADQE